MPFLGALRAPLPSENTRKTKGFGAFRGLFGSPFWAPFGAHFRFIFGSNTPTMSSADFQKSENLFKRSRGVGFYLETRISSSIGRILDHSGALFGGPSGHPFERKHKENKGFWSFPGARFGPFLGPFGGSFWVHVGSNTPTMSSADFQKFPENLRISLK